MLGLEPVQSCLGVARVMSEQKVTTERRTMHCDQIPRWRKVPSAEIHHRLQQQYGEECLLYYMLTENLVNYDSNAAPVVIFNYHTKATIM